MNELGSGDEISLSILPNWKKKVEEPIVKSAVTLTQSLIVFSEGKKLNADIAKKVQNKLSNKISGLNVFSGGSSALFAWSFPWKGHDERILIKPYYSREFNSLVLHHLTNNEFGTVRTYAINNDFISIKIPPTLGVGEITYRGKKYPLLLTLESKGLAINDPKLIKVLSKITKNLALEGFIVDLYPANWRKIPSNFGTTLEYIDLISANNISDFKHRIQELLKQL